MSRQEPAITAIITDRPMIPNTRNELVFFERSLTAFKSLLDLCRSFTVDVVIFLACQDRKRLPAVGKPARLGRHNVPVTEPGH